MLVLLSDGMLQDLPSSSEAGLAALRRAHVHDLMLLVPARVIAVPGEWTAAFPLSRPTVFDGTDADATALAIGRAIASSTGQELSAR